MTARIQFRAIYGANRFEPLCFLLKVDQFELLLDCGWNSSFDEETIAGLKDVDLSNVDAVLLSQPDLLRIGALPYAYAHCGLTAPIYATTPVWRVGQYMVTDAYVSALHRYSNFSLFTGEDIKHVFQRKFAQKLKYSQQFPLLKDFDSESGDTIEQNRLVITPLPGGHMIGGTLWRISKETETIVYAIDCNVRREKHLNESAFVTLHRPTLLITDAFNIGYQFDAKRSSRDKQLCSSVFESLKNGGNVLIPSDSGGRCLELLLILHQYFARNKYFSSYHLIFLSYTAKDVIAAAKSMLEWMSDSTQKELDTKGKNVFDFKELLVCQSREEFRTAVATNERPFVCVATNEFLEGGFSQDLFLELNQNRSNLILLTSRVSDQTVAGKLYKLISSERRSNPKTIEFQFIRKEKMSDKERSDWIARKQMKELQTKQEQQLQRQQQISFQTTADHNTESLPNATTNANDTNNVNNSDTNGASTSAVDSSVQSKSNPKSKSNPTMAAVQLPNESDDVEMNENLHFLYDASQRKRIRMESSFLMFPFSEFQQSMSPYGYSIDMPFFREFSNEHPGVLPKGVTSGDSVGADKHETKSNEGGGDVVDQTMSILNRHLGNDPSLDEQFKTVKEMKTFTIICDLQFVNCEGRSDGESIKQTLMRISPRQTILVHSDAKNAQILQQFLESKAIQHVRKANNGEWFEIATATKYHQIIVSPELDRQLQFVTVNECEVAFVDGCVVDLEDTSDNDGDVSMTDKTHFKPYRYTLDPVSTAEDVQTKALDYRSSDRIGHRLSYIGDVTKIELEREFVKNNMAAGLYPGGHLVCGSNGEVRVNNKKHNRDIVSIEGALTADYFQIRDLVMKHYHLL